MDSNAVIIFQYITFNPVVINGNQTFDNMFIALDNEDKIGAGMVFPQVEVKADAGKKS
jgi:hypothetical protein